MCLSKAMTILIKTLHKYNFYSYYDLGVMKEFFNAKSNISTNIVKVETLQSIIPFTGYIIKIYNICNVKMSSSKYFNQMFKGFMIKLLYFQFPEHKCSQVKCATNCCVATLTYQGLAHLEGS